MIKITFEGEVTRIYDETRGERTNNYIVVMDDAGGKYPNILRFTAKAGVQPACKAGDRVKVSAYLDGREWTNSEGKTFYFTDLRIDTVEVLVPAAPAAPAAKPTQANDWATLLALASAYGEDQSAVTERCKAHKAKVNRTFTPQDWQAVADEIVSAHAPEVPSAGKDPFEGDNMPF